MAQKDWLINKREGVCFLTEPLHDFEAAYTAVRTKEQRILSDEEVRQLPKSTKYSTEWRTRAWTAERFTNYLDQKPFTQILEIGCGNGWFSHYLSSDQREVYGLDVGEQELVQAARCFGSERVHFVCCSDWSLLPKGAFDCIVFNGSAHYFQPDEAFWNQLYSLLTAKGEIHILESFLYRPKEAVQARQRSENYFKTLGEASAASYYHHLKWKDFPEQSELQYSPSWLLNKIFPSRSPFPWIRIQRPSNTSK